MHWTQRCTIANSRQARPLNRVLDPEQALGAKSVTQVLAIHSSYAVVQAPENHGYGDMFRAYDKRDGRVLASLTLPFSFRR